jgi:hypothetical protein
MSLTSSVFTLSNSTATKIVNTWHTPQRVTLHNMTKSSNQYVHFGPSTVTTTNSIHIDPGETLEILVVPGDELYAVSDPNGLEVGVFVSRS